MADDFFFPLAKNDFLSLLGWIRVIIHTSSRFLHIKNNSKVSSACNFISKDNHSSIPALIEAHEEHWPLRTTICFLFFKSP